jgi:putative ABC transport system substrate-binding protein
MASRAPTTISALKQIVRTEEILRGAKPADLPAQQAAKLQLVLNLNTAKALGIEIPPSVIAIADEVIE